MKNIKSKNNIYIFFIFKLILLDKVNRGNGVKVLEVFFKAEIKPNITKIELVLILM